MAYATLMVNLELGSLNTGLLNFASGLARRLDAAVFGIVARHAMQIVYNDTCYVTLDMIQQDRAEMQEQMRHAEAEFYRAMGALTHRLQSRSKATSERPHRFVARDLRSADLILTSWLAFGGVTRDLLLQRMLHAPVTLTDDRERCATQTAHIDGHQCLKILPG